jgi:hypothetical protein
LADGEQFYEGFVVEPGTFRNEAAAQIGDNAPTKTRGSDEEKLQEDLQNRGRGAPWIASRRRLG